MKLGELAEQVVLDRLKQAVLQLAFQLILGVIDQKAAEQTILRGQRLAAIRAFGRIGWQLAAAPDAVVLIFHGRIPFFVFS